MKKQLAINTKPCYFRSSENALVRDFRSGSRCLCLGFGCEVAPAADLLSVLMEGAPRKRERGRRSCWAAWRGLGTVPLLGAPAAPGRMCQGFGVLGSSVSQSSLHAWGKPTPESCRSPEGPGRAGVAFPQSQEPRGGAGTTQQDLSWVSSSGELSSWGIPLPLQVPCTGSSALSFAAVEPVCWWLSRAHPCTGGCWQDTGSCWDPLGSTGIQPVPNAATVPLQSHVCWLLCKTIFVGSEGKNLHRSQGVD